MANSPYSLQTGCVPSAQEVSPRLQVPWHSTVFASTHAVNWEVQKSNGARTLTNIKEIPVAPYAQTSFYPTSFTLSECKVHSDIGDFLTL